jgi:hypothetical protein
MHFQTMTLDERERFAYVTGSPLAPLLAAACDTVQIDALQEELLDVQNRLDDAKVLNSQLKDKLSQIGALCTVSR